MSSTIDTLLNRRSVLANNLREPGPTEAEIQQILAAAHRVPDHGKIGPWRFTLFTGDARVHFGEKLRAIFAADKPDASAKLLQFEADRIARAPLVIAVISAPQDHPKVTAWEQALSAGAACQNILLAASALGYGAQWLTEWYSYHEAVSKLLALDDNEKIAGFIYIGQFEEAPAERVRPGLEERVDYWANTQKPA